MQTMDKHNQVIDVTTGTPNELAQRIEELQGRADKMGGEPMHHVIGKLPKKKSIIIMGGLQYKVIYSDYITGIFHAKLIGFKPPIK